MESTDEARIIPSMSATVDGKHYSDLILFLSPIPSGQHANATSLICLPAENLTAYIDGAQLGGGAYLFWDGTGTLVYATKAFDGADLRAMTDYVMGGASGSVEAKLSGGENLLTWHLSSQCGWRFAQVMPMDAILGEANALQARSVTLMLCVLAVCCLLIALAMRLNYLPIKRLAQLAKDEDAGRPGDDFSAIQRLVTRLTNENDRLGERLNMAEPQAREALVSQLFSGNIDEQMGAIRRAELFSVELHADHYQVALAEYASAEEAEDACANISQANNDECGLIVAQVDINRRVALLLNRDVCAREEGILAHLSGAKYVAYGMVVAEAGQISISYSSACAAIDILRTTGEDRRVIHYDDLPDRTFNPRSYPLEVMQSLETAIYHSSAESFEELMAQIESLIALDSAPPYFTRSVYFNVINLLISGLTRHLGEENALVREIGLRSMLNHYTVPEMVHILKLTAGQLLFRMRENAQKNTPVTDALVYIETHISSPSLCLQEVADHVGLSASAFSRGFKEKVGRNFKEYIDAARILRAKTMLEGTDIPIEQIAVSVGYDTLTSFYRMFKKSVGMAPGEYRQSQSKLQLSEKEKESEKR